MWRGGEGGLDEDAADAEGRLVCQDLSMTSLDRAQLASLIDHTLLKPESTPEDVAALAREAEELGTYSICVSPSMLPVETTVKVATVCGFPSGQHSAEVKAFEAREAVSKGVDEIVDFLVENGGLDQLRQAS